MAKVFGLRADASHPIIDDYKVKCHLGQDGDVWFLGGVYGESGVAERECDVPVGKALFFPIVNVICSEFTGDDDPLACAENPTVPPGFEFQMNPLSATIDGQEVGNLEEYYVLSDEIFTLGPLLKPNIFNAPKGAVGEGATSGYYLLLPPLAEGKHNITFAGEIVVLDPGGNPVYYFKPDISYHLTVVDDD